MVYTFYQYIPHSALHTSDRGVEENAAISVHNPLYPKTIRCNGLPLMTGVTQERKQTWNKIISHPPGSKQLLT